VKKVQFSWLHWKFKVPATRLSPQQQRGKWLIDERGWETAWVGLLKREREERRYLSVLGEVE